MTEIIELDSHILVGHYIPHLDRIEISKDLRDFPDLYAFVLEHEKHHAKTKNILTQVKIDYIDRWKLHTNNVLWNQYKAFRKRRQAPLKSLLTWNVYYWLGIPTAFFGFLRLKGLKQWLKEQLEVFLE